MTLTDSNKKNEAKKDTASDVARAIRNSQVSSWDKREIAANLVSVLNVKDEDAFVRLASDPHYPA